MIRAEAGVAPFTTRLGNWFYLYLCNVLVLSSGMFKPRIEIAENLDGFGTTAVISCSLALKLTPLLSITSCLAVFGNYDRNDPNGDLIPRTSILYPRKWYCLMPWLALFTHYWLHNLYALLCVICDINAYEANSIYWMQMNLAGALAWQMYTAYDMFRAVFRGWWVVNMFYMIWYC